MQARRNAPSSGEYGYTDYGYTDYGYTYYGYTYYGYTYYGCTYDGTEQGLGQSIEVGAQLLGLRCGGEAGEERAGRAQQLTLRLAQARHE